jgi:hypothetical protein
MDEQHGRAPVEFLPHRCQTRVSERDARPAGGQQVAVRVCFRVASRDLGQSRVRVVGGQAGEQTEAAGVVGDELSAVVVPGAQLREGDRRVPG